MNTLTARSILLITFFISGFLHQALYAVFPALALMYLSGNDFSLKPDRVSALYFKFLLFVVAILFLQTIYWMDLKSYSVKGALRFLAYLSFAIVAARLSVASIRMVLTKIAWIFLLLIPYGIFETMRYDRYVFLFHHANNLAYVFVLLIYFLCLSDIRYKWLLLAGMLFSLILTKSSGGLVTGTIVVFGFFLFNHQISRMRKVLLSLVIGIVLFAFLSLFPERIMEQYNSISGIDWDIVFDRAGKTKFGMFGSGIWRLTYWIAILQQFFRNSASALFVGMGLDSLTLGNYIYPFMTKDPHNDYVKLIVELGFLGVIFFLYFIRQVFLISNRSFLLVIIMLIPMNFGNILVNFPFMILFITLLNYKIKSEQAAEIIPSCTHTPEVFTLQGV